MGLQTFEQDIPFYNESQSQARKDQDRINIQYLLDCILNIPKHSWSRHQEMKLDQLCTVHRMFTRKMIRRRIQLE